MVGGTSPELATVSLGFIFINDVFRNRIFHCTPMAAQADGGKTLKKDAALSPWFVLMYRLWCDTFAMIFFSKPLIVGQQKNVVEL
jgi:hypothetical protein